MTPHSLRKFLTLAVLLSVLAAMAPLQAQTEVIPVRSGPMSQTLNGDWTFKYIPSLDLGEAAGFHQPGFEPAGWSSISVPSNWEMHGFGELIYKFPEAGTGLYRRHFRVPADWNGQKVFVHFDGVLYGFDLWVNGVKCGTWGSGYNPVGFDITAAIKPGVDNLLAVQVTTRNMGWEFDTNDCWGLSGIYRDVTLFALPDARFNDYAARTKLKSDGSAELEIKVSATAGSRVTGELLSPAGGPARKFQFPLGADSAGSTVLTIPKPHLWTAETPALYRLRLVIESDQGAGQRIEEKIGLREITIEGKVLKLNGRPIKLRGVNHHDIWPDVGRAANESHLRSDLELIRKANINFIRTAHYPPHPRLIELCDELGFYVMCEVPFGGGDEHLTNPDYGETLLVRARATVRRDHNRPSIIAWSVGNENPVTTIQLEAGREVKRLDPSRPICFPTMGSYFDASYDKFPDFVDIHAPHYPVNATLQRYAETLSRPVILSEYAHALGLGTDRIQDQWEIMQASPGLAGGAIWMFQDQGLLRTRAEPLREDEETPYVWLDAHRYYDTGRTRGMDGIVYSDRRPQVDYWQVRKVYSPVQVVDKSLNVGVGKQSVELHVSNRFDFRSLDGYRLEWTLQRNGKAVKTGSVPLSASAQSIAAVKIALVREAEKPGDVDALAVRCLDEGKNSIYEHTFWVNQQSGLAASGVLDSHSTPAVLKLEQTETKARVIHPRFEVSLDRKTGEISIQNRAGGTLISGLFPHMGRRFTESDKARVSRNGVIWAGSFMERPTMLSTEAISSAEGITLRVAGRYAREDVPEQFIEGSHTLVIRPNGKIDVSYRYHPSAVAASVLEGGLALIVPADSATNLRWIGAGPYAGYPGKDRLNEFGLHHLSHEDLNFHGNRRNVEVALLTASDGRGVGINGHDMDVAVEKTAAFTLLKHNAVVSGRGNKAVLPETDITAVQTKVVTGNFELRLFEKEWPAALVRWFGPSDKRPENMQASYYRSYDR